MISSKKKNNNNNESDEVGNGSKKWDNFEWVKLKKLERKLK